MFRDALKLLCFLTKEARKKGEEKIEEKEEHEYKLSHLDTTLFHT